MTIKIFEIYTKNPDTGETGWDIEFVRSTPLKVQTFPNFDCIIEANDDSAGLVHDTGCIDW